MQMMVNANDGESVRFNPYFGRKIKATEAKEHINQVDFTSICIVLSYDDRKPLATYIDRQW